VVAYVHVSFLASFSVLPRFQGVDDVLALDVSSQEPRFGTVTGFWHWMLVQGTQLQEGPKR